MSRRKSLVIHQKRIGNYPLHQLRYGIISSLIVLGASVPAQVQAEEFVRQRIGNFAIPGPTPSCDGIGDQLGSVGEFVVDGVLYLGETTINTAIGFSEFLISGNPNALLDEVNKVFEDAASAAATVSKYSPLALLSVIIDQLPEGSVTTFLASGNQMAQELTAALAAGVVSGANPVAAAETVINDFTEIAGDLGQVLINLDDPLSAGNEFLKLNQKWNAAGSLTYIFTEKDPMTGMKKALNALHRQVEIVAGQVGPSGKVASALLDHTMEKSKEYIAKLPDGENKKVATLFAATFAVTFKTSLSDPNFSLSKNVSRHPIYSAELREVNGLWLGDSHNSGSEHFWGFQHPVIEGKPGCISLGDHAYPGKRGIKTKALCNVEEGRNVWWSRPVDYKLVWGDNCSGGTHDRSVWLPVCDTGYVSVGFVASGGSRYKPLPNAIACLKDDINLLGVASGEAAGLKWVANDKGSGAKFDLALYNREFLGMQLMYALPKDYAPNNTEYKKLRVPVPVAGQKPSYSKDMCVNFYTEPNYKGWTHELCDLNVQSTIPGKNNQMLNGGVSSFQCGDQVAGVLLITKKRDGSNTLNNKVVDCKAGQYLGEYDNFGYSVETKESYVDPTTKKVILSPKATAIKNAALAKELAVKAADEEALFGLPMIDALTVKGLQLVPGKGVYFWVADYDATATFEINFKHADGDLNVQLYDQNFNLIGVSDSPTDDNEFLIQDVSQDETFIMLIKAVDGASNPFSLDITVEGTNDSDQDGVLDVDDAFPDDAFEQSDQDGDGIGDNADQDNDNDGLPDSYEIENGFDPFEFYDAFETDTDNDGYEDFFEYLEGSDPNDAESVPDEFFDPSLYGATTSDYDGDGIADIAFRNAGTGFFYVKSSYYGDTESVSFGRSKNDIPLEGDFDGDGIADIAIRRPSNGTWYVLNSSDGEMVVKRFGGEATDIPLPADYDGDGITDFAIRRPSNHTWYILRSSDGGKEVLRFGVQSGDIPVPADYDGDGQVDIAIRRPSNGSWYIKQSSDNKVKVVRFGTQSSDIPVPADYDGDGRADIAIRRISNSTWYIQQSSDNKTRVVRFGLQTTDIPVVADYDGDGQADIAIRRPSNLSWYILRSSDNKVAAVKSGLNAGYIPILTPILQRMAMAKNGTASAKAGNVVSAKEADEAKGLEDATFNSSPEYSGSDLTKQLLEH